MRTKPLTAVPDRLLRTRGPHFQADRVVAFLGWRPSLLAVETERQRRGL